MRLDCYDESESEHLDKLIHSENYVLVDKNYFEKVKANEIKIETLVSGIKEIVLRMYDEITCFETTEAQNSCSSILSKIKEFNKGDWFVCSVYIVEITWFMIKKVKHIFAQNVVNTLTLQPKGENYERRF